MTKGRSSKPSTVNEGNWFCHKDARPPGGVNTTTTGEMLETPFHPNIAFKSIKNSTYFQPKTAMNFKCSNTFSAHDNKRSFITDSAYFSYAHNNRTLGKRQCMSDQSLHYTDAKFLHHPKNGSSNKSISPTLVTTYRISYYDGKKPTDQLIFRRFPKVYSAATHGSLEPRLRASHWFKDPEDYKASTQTLVGSLSPYIKHNPWKLSYQNLSKVYPN